MWPGSLWWRFRPFVVWGFSCLSDFGGSVILNHQRGAVLRWFSLAYKGVNMTSIISDLAAAISGAKFFSVEYHSKGKEYGPKGAKVTKGDHVVAFSAQVVPLDTVQRSSVKALRGLAAKIGALHAGLARDVLVRDYRVPKKHGGGSRVEVLTVEDLDAARLREIASLEDPEGRSAAHTQRDKWERVAAGIWRKVEAPDVLALRVYVKPGSSVVKTPPPNGYHVANSTREARARAVIREWMRAGDARTLLLDRVQALAAGGRNWARDSEGSLVLC